MGSVDFYISIWDSVLPTAASSVEYLRDKKMGPFPIKVGRRLDLSCLSGAHVTFGQITVRIQFIR